MKKVSKYQKGDFVIINKIFSTESDLRGRMEDVKPMIARVVRVEYTSMGPNYKLELLDDPDRKLKIMYWESDIFGPYDL